MKEISFEEKIKKIESIVEILENGEEPIEKMLSNYNQGIKLINECRDYINAAELKFIDISKQNNLD